MTAPGPAEEAGAPTHLRQHIGRKRRGDSRLGRLSKAKQDDLYDYCSTVMLKEGVEWIREKFGINLATKTLSAWLINERVDREFGVLLASVEDDARRAYQMEGALSNAPDFPKIVAQMLGQRMFEAMRTGARGTLKKFLQLYTLLISTLIKSDNSKLARAKFEFDGVREVKKYASEVKTILTDKSLHQDTRLERVRPPCRRYSLPPHLRAGLRSRISGRS